MRATKNPIARERLTLSKMVGIYCAGHHENIGHKLCDSCQGFLHYADIRLEKCPYGENKPTCANCLIHCYKLAQKTKAKTIMQYAGPRMLLRHPLLTAAHQLDGLRRVGHPRNLTRKQRLRPREKSK